MNNFNKRLIYWVIWISLINLVVGIIYLIFRDSILNALLVVISGFEIPLFIISLVVLIKILITKKDKQLFKFFAVYFFVYLIFIIISVLDSFNEDELFTLNDPVSIINFIANIIFYVIIIYWGYKLIKNFKFSSSKTFYLKNNDEIILTWRGSKYKDLKVLYKDKEVFSTTRLKAMDNNEFSLPNGSKILLKPAYRWLSSGFDVLEDGDYLKGSKNIPKRLLRDCWGSFIFIFISNLGLGLALIFYFGRGFYIGDEPRITGIVGIIFAFLFLLLGILVRYRLSRIALMIAVIIWSVDIIFTIYMASSAFIWINIIVRLALLSFLIKGFRAINDLTKIKGGKLKLFLIWLLPSIIFYFGVSIFIPLMTSSEEIDNDFNYSNYYLMGDEAGYYDGLDNLEVCQSCQVPEDDGQGEYMEGYYDGYYWGCIEAANGCEINLPEDVLRSIEGYETISPPENIS